MSYYLAMAFSYYLSAACLNAHTFKNMTWTNFYLGIIGALFFPITSILLLYEFAYPPFKDTPPQEEKE